MGEKRQRLLPLSRRFANLPSGTKAKYVHPESFYSFGWSHGKEKLAGGRPDVTKGSFYNNPTTNRPFDDEDIIAEYPSVRPSYIHTAGMLSPLHTAHTAHTTHTTHNTAHCSCIPNATSTVLAATSFALFCSPLPSPPFLSYHGSTPLVRRKRQNRGLPDPPPSNLPEPSPLDSVLAVRAPQRLAGR